MRIIGGIYKGRILCPFENIGVRPTSDMTRESLFNILRDKVCGARFLDLFSGTGAVAIEALSRGAGSVTANDSGRDAISLIKKNLEKLKIQKSIEVTFYDALSFIDSINSSFDIIYVDPPYTSGIYEKLLLGIHKIMDNGGIAVFESEKPIEYLPDNLIKYDQRKYGRAYLTFYKKE